MRLLLTMFIKKEKIIILVAVFIFGRGSCSQPNATTAYTCGNRTCLWKQVCVQRLCVCVSGYVPLENGECVDRDECTRSVCRGKGTCLNTIGSFRCECLRGWGGNHCSDPDPRETNRTCMPGYKPPLCCRPGWAGSDCHTDVDECSNSSLNNCTGLHEKCRNQRGRYQCYCDPGWDGPHCTQDVNECLSAPCMKDETDNGMGGSYNCTCVNSIGSYTCRCQRDFPQSDHGKSKQSVNVVVGSIVGSVSGLFAICVIAGLSLRFYLRSKRKINTSAAIDNEEI